MYYWMMALEEVSLPIIERGFVVEEQVSKKEFSKLLAGVVQKTGEKRLWIDCKLGGGKRVREESCRLVTSL